MKRFLLLSCLLACFASLSAQNYDYKPRETWPYLLEEFTSGGVHTCGGEDINEGWYNVSVLDGKLHFVQNGYIMEADMRQVKYARIGESLYVNRMGKMEQVVAEEGPYVLLLSVLVDMASLSKSDIGYGVSSATATTQNINNLGMTGAVTVSTELEAAIAGAKYGTVLPLRKRYDFMLGARQIEASRAAVMALPGIDKAAAKSFFKQEKINWNKQESLAKVLKYLADNNL